MKSVFDKRRAALDDAAKPADKPKPGAKLKALSDVPKSQQKRFDSETTYEYHERMKKLGVEE